jgi:hypothetical protein
MKVSGNLNYYVSVCKHCRGWYCLALSEQVHPKHAREIIARALYVLGWLWVNEFWYCPTCCGKLGRLQRAKERRDKHLIIPVVDHEN